jgi:hypothetical protein
MNHTINPIRRPQITMLRHILAHKMGELVNQQIGEELLWVNQLCFPHLLLLNNNQGKISLIRHKPAHQVALIRIFYKIFYCKGSIRNI